MLKEQISINTSACTDHNFYELLRLYNLYSEDIKLLKGEKSNLENFLKNLEVADESLTLKMSEISKQIKIKNNLIKEFKYKIACLISESKESIQFLEIITQIISKEFSTEITTLIENNNELSKKLKSALAIKIADVYGIKHENIITGDKLQGKQDGFIITDKSTGLKLFIKTSKVFRDDIKSVDPREKFAYKVLENMELGPETRFIFTPGASNSTGAKICHIVTKDVEYSNDKDIKNVFFTDNFITEKDPHIDALKHWEKSFSNKEFRVNFFTLSIVFDLLQLNDSFANNA